MKRITVTTLWFFAGWSVGAMVAFSLGLPQLTAPAVAVLLAVIAFQPGLLTRVSRLEKRSPAARLN